jgi:c-di-GMP-binding flagellar brake protein YcgR
MTVGSMAIVKFTYMGKLCMFESKLIKTLDSPLQLLFFEYPKVIYYHEMRKAKRTSIYIPCSLDLQGQGSFAGTVLDISSSGTLCQLKARRNESLPSVSIRQSIQLRCILPGLTDEQTIPGIIRNIKTNSHEIRLGVEFSNLGPRLKETINHYLVEPV